MNPSEHSQETEYSGSVVVVIDDNDRLRQLLALAVETAGFEVIAAATELELQRYLSRHRPDALVIDLQRSVADGFDLLVRMRARHSLRDVPILFLSGTDAEDFRYQAVSAGADWFGLRPLGMIELTRRIGELVRCGRTPEQQQPRDGATLKRVG
jgi:DNA-binding response OmpR family regulator